MQSHRFLREADGNVLAVVTLTVAAIFGTVGLTMNPDSLDTAPWTVAASAHAVVPAPDGTSATKRQPDEGQSAGRSAQATRSDAAQ